MLVALDVGHIGKPHSIRDKGAVYNGICEADLVLFYVTITRSLLEMRNVNTVLLTHQEYSQRKLFCKQVRADIHLQCHLNAAGGKYGLILYNEINPTDCHSLASKIAKQFEANLPITLCKIEKMKEKDRRNSCVMDSIPSLLLEPLFLDNPDHFKFLQKDEGVVEIAKAIVAGILD